MRCDHLAIFPASAAALLAGLFFAPPASAQSTENFYYYSGGVQIPLISRGQDTDGRPLFQTADSIDNPGAALAENLLALTNQFMIQSAPGTDIGAFAQQHDLAPTPPLHFGTGLYLFDTASPFDALNLANQAFESGAALIAEPQFARQQFTRDVPNDPMFTSQWHLRNTGQSGGTVGADVNAVPWWNFAGGTRQGSGVNIAIVDDGLQHTHPDLAANYKPNLSRDINFNDSDPAPNTSFDFHGTAVAGVAGARGNNGVGVSGVAPMAGLAGIRLIAGGITDAQEAQGLTWQNNNQGGLGTNSIYSNSWGPNDNGSTLAGPGTQTKAAFANAVTTGRGGKGSIFTWAGGNGHQNLDNVNYDGYANSRFVIAVGASRNDANGSRSSYSESGASLLVNAPSNGGTLAVTTTDLIGSNGYSSTDYTSSFGGTSSATPVVSGAIALMLEANPNLGWRDVKHILVNTAQKNDPLNSDWILNAAGHHVNHAYGFGRVDASAAATLATAWLNVGPEVFDSASSGSLGLAIADGTGASFSSPIYGAPVTNSLLIDDPIRVEMLDVSVNVTHPYRGELQFILTAPTGTQSILGTTRNDSGDNYNNWVFTSARHWDEMANGLWTLSVRDGMSTDVGTLNSWSISVFGTMVPEPSSVSLIAIALLGVGVRRRVRYSA